MHGFAEERGMGSEEKPSGCQDSLWSRSCRRNRQVGVARRTAAHARTRSRPTAPARMRISQQLHILQLREGDTGPLKHPHQPYTWLRPFDSQPQPWRARVWMTFGDVSTLYLLCRTYFGASEPVSALAQRPGLAVLRVNLSFHLYFRPALVCAHAPLSGVFALQCVLVHVMEEKEGFLPVGFPWFLGGKL